MHLVLISYYLVVVIGFSGASMQSVLMRHGIGCRREVNTAPVCVNNCNVKRSTFLEFRAGNLWETICLQESLSNLVKKAVDSEKQLPKPATPTLVGAEWQTIRLSFNSTELEKLNDLDYILEVRPHWGPQETGKFFAVFPYTKKYHYTNQSTYSIEDLEPNTGYQFRVIVLQLGKSSSFSNWSEIINTTRNCTTPSCGVTNIHLELMSRKPYPRDEDLESTFRWKPSVRISEDNEDSFKRLSLLSANYKHCGEYFLQSKQSRIDFGAKGLMGKKQLFYSFDKNYGHLEHNCWYKFEIGARRYPSNVEFASRSFIFRVPDCIRIKNVDICGCDYVEDYEHKTRHINVTFERSSPNTVTMFLFWSDLNWRKSANLTYFFVRLEQSRKHFFEKYVNASHNVTQYNITIYNLISGKDYYLRIYGFHKDHCKHKDVEELSFVAIPPCENVTCQANATCHSFGYDGEYECRCNDGFSKGEGYICIAIRPCENVTCQANATCHSLGYNRKPECRCNDGFFQGKGDICIGKPTVTNPDNNKGVITAAILTPLVVILLATCAIVWLKQHHKKRMNSMKRELKCAINIGLAGGSRSMEIGILSDENNQKVLNCIYISQDNVQEISFYEVRGDALKYGSMIGRGAFGKVYIGEARGINGNPDWITVAIKTLSESAKEDEFFDFLREIEIMKDVGKHKNVIQMFGCCIRRRPICLVLEFAPGGNLLNYLRSLKQKCRDIARVRTNKVTKSDKEKYEKFFEPGETPLSTSFSFPDDDNGLTKLDGNGIKNTEEVNLEIVTKVKEEIRAALNPKELESFARQIATGMKHISDHGIVHRDLAARNILIGIDKILKISDFGLSREGTYVKTTRGKVPFRWLSIEAIQEQSYSTASDVWAFGVVLWEICTLGEMPYSSVSDKDLKNFLLSGKRLEKVDSCTDVLYEIMLKCWSHLPTHRPTFDELSNKLWDLEHKGSAYVNVENLLESVENEDPEHNEQINKADKYSEGSSDDKNPDSRGDTEVGLDDFSANEEMDNHSFERSREDVNANEQRYLVSSA